jgi:hypothetical protein
MTHNEKMLKYRNERQKRGQCVVFGCKNKISVRSKCHCKKHIIIKREYMREYRKEVGKRNHAINCKVLRNGK